jgi:hypothetical protein
MDIQLGNTTLTVTPATQADVWGALQNNQPFPDRTVNIGDIQARYASGDIPINLGAGANVSLTASFSASGHSGIGIYLAAADAIKALQLDPSVTPNFPAGQDDRFLMLSFDATAQGSVSGKAPIGVVASATFGAKAAASTRFALLYRFHKDTPAHTVLQHAWTGVKLPRQVRSTADLMQGMWIIAEVDGSLALSAAATVGYDYTYTRDLPSALQQLGLSKDLSVKVDLAAEATVTYNVSGRYLVMVGRPSLVADVVIALQVNKGNSYGYGFGLNLSAGVQMGQILPNKGEDLVAASFGVFGPQIVTDVSNSISALEAWSSGDLAGNTAGLTITTAKALLTQVTGINSDNAISEATGKLKDAVSKWNGLVGQGSTDLQTLAWNLLGNPSDKALIVTLLTDLRDNNSFDEALSDGLQSLPGQTWLMGIADAVGADSMLSLGSYQPTVQKIAGYALDVLSNNILGELQTYILDRFKLTALIETATDPSKLDQWVQDRLAAVLNKGGINASDLKNIQTAINALLGKFTDLYAKTAAALTKKYNFAFAATYEKIVENATLLNLSFDTTAAAAANLYLSVLDGDTSAIFSLPAPQKGLTIAGAQMSHSIHSMAKTSLTIPFLPAIVTVNTNTSVASLSFEQNGANLIGTVNAVDQAQSNRYNSMLKLALSLGIHGGSLSSLEGSMAYELRVIAKRATTALVTNTTSLFVQTYLPNKFGANDYSTRLLADFDSAVNQPTASFGDMLMSMQVAIDGDFLSAWVVSPDRLKNAQIIASRIAQQRLRHFTHSAYFAKEDNPDSWATLPLLVWESFPICTGIAWDASTETLSAVNTGSHYYLSNEDGDPLYKALINSTSPDLASHPGLGMLHLTAALAYNEVISKGIRNPSFISSPTDVAAKNMISYVFDDSRGFPFLRSLMIAEAAVVNGVAKALENITDASADISTSDPTKLIEHLADFGATLTKALNSNMKNLFASATDLRPFGPMLFVELTKGLADATSGIQTKAMLELKSLKPLHTFDINTYVLGSDPSSDQIAVSQTVVSV